MCPYRPDLIVRDLSIADVEFHHDDPRRRRTNEADLSTPVIRSNSLSRKKYFPLPTRSSACFSSWVLLSVTGSQYCSIFVFSVLAVVDLLLVLLVRMIVNLPPRNFQTALYNFSFFRKKDKVCKHHSKNSNTHSSQAKLVSTAKTRKRQRRHSKMAVSRRLGYYRIGNSAIRSADPENPCLEPDME